MAPPTSENKESEQQQQQQQQLQQAGGDERRSWIDARIISSLKLKQAELKKIDENEECRRALMEFMDVPDVQHLFLVQDGSTWIATTTAPDSFKKKSLYFMKNKKAKLTNDNIEEIVSVGDISNSPLESLSLLAKEVFVPLLANKTHKDSMDIASKDVISNFHKFLSTIYVTIGQTQGKTLLPLPIESENQAENGSNNKDFIHVLEGSVITWIKQIRDVLDTDPEDLLKSGRHPGPLAEIQFWEEKAENLNSIHDQLNGEKVRKVLDILRLCESSYYPSFEKLMGEVEHAREEANDNIKFLRPLRPYFEQLNIESATHLEFTELKDTFNKMMHLIYLVWKHSKYYNKPTRLVVLIREICNDLIEQARAFVEVNQIFEIEPPEAVSKLNTTLKICGAFKDCYFVYKNKVADELKNTWRVQVSALFQRLDSFLERCHDILELTELVVLFMSLEKIEIGGTKGFTLTNSIREIHAQFFKAFQRFKQVPYDLLDVENKQFDDDFYEFRSVLKELERRLGSILTKGFDECTTISASLKLIESFEGLLEREIIHQDLEKYQSNLVTSYIKDLILVQETFQTNKESPPMYANMPPTAGALIWCQGLLDRINEPMQKLNQVSPSMLDTVEGREALKMHASITEVLRDFMNKKYQQWSNEVASVSSEKLQQPLLRRDETTRLLKVNFDPALVRLLREVNYIEKMNEGQSSEDKKLAIPTEALDIFKKVETYRTQTGKLDLIVNMYNNILTSLINVEKPLLKTKLNAIDQQLEPGLNHSLNWSSEGIDDFIAGSMTLVRESSAIQSTLKNNVNAIKKVLAAWEKNLIFERKEPTKSLTPEQFGKRYEETKALREKEIREGAELINNKLAESLKVLQGISADSPEWRSYVQYINDIVVSGITKSIINNLTSVNDQVAPRSSENNLPPLFEITLSLIVSHSDDPEKSAVFSPPLDGKGGTGSIEDIVNGWIADFSKISTFVRRLDTQSGDYMKEVTENEKRRALVEQIRSRISSNANECRAFRNQFLSYSYLWTNDIKASFKAFLESITEQSEMKPKKEGETKEEHSDHADGDNENAPDADADHNEDDDSDNGTLHLFRDQIIKYEKLQEEISLLPDSANIGWLSIDAKPMKSALHSTCGKWKSSFTDYLSNKVISSLESLYTFMDTVSVGIDQEVNGDTVLKEVMGHIRDVKFRMKETEAMFAPLRKIAEMLKKHGCELPEEINKKIEECKPLWKNILNKAMLKREQLGPLQDQEAKKIKDEMLRFNEKIRQFRTQFNENAPFDWSVGTDKAYEALDKWNKLLVAIEAEADTLRNLQELFELTVSEYKDLKDCRSELELLKILWDMTYHVLAQFKEWMKTPFKLVDVDFLTDESKKLMNIIKNFPTKARFWDVFKGLSSTVKNMLTALPLVQDLRDPSMRDRHWKALLRETKKPGNINPEDENFSLQQLLDLGLHDYVEEVATIVDKAKKELKIEQSITKIKQAWVNLEFVFTENTELNCVTLGSVDEIIEVLEDHQVQLNGMSANRFVEFFIAEVTKWQRMLATVDSIITLWIEVQRSWTNLYPIFVLSADIRTQLPEDSRRFEGSDKIYRALMAQAKDVPNVIEACTQDTIRKKMQLTGNKDLNDILSDMQEDFEKCEKALADYLETKRRAFPRFYFVAPADLVDILSKGSYPQQVMKHMNKLADGIETLIFDGDSKVATGMISKEGEQVDFHQPYNCVGPVEDWLNGILDTMRDTLRHLLGEAHSSYIEQPRDKWLFLYAAQVVIVVSRVWWTTEVNAAFDKLEESNEEGALKEYNKQQIEQLEKLTTLVQGKLTSGDRKKIITLITVDVHSRDVVQKLIEEKVDNSQVFTWQSQLRYTWDDKKGCLIDIADAQFKYSYEYIGNCGCLVITPLTDRCYITLTQSLRLVMGGAPAGPAGTGKTETTKDLARALGAPCYVFNCTEQMDYLSLGNIFKGLAMTGAWGCFDEFNRIPVNVLSVVATQFKSILDAIKKEKTRFIFQHEEITLNRSCGAFITMNPGYKGRTELPENLKALFRPCAMIVPDLNNICEIMLASEGFKDAKTLAKKFVTLYGLNKELLSKQDHYDWGLRAIKSVLVIAGSLKRAEPNISEDKILMRALRDTNLAKLSRDDIEIFKGLISDLFPKMDLPAKKNPDLEKAAKEAAESSGLQTGENDMFILKVVQFKELLDVRHSVFVLGPAGSGKTCVWQTLAKALTSMGQKTQVHTLDPKAVSSNELYGYINPVTREWKDGLLSHIMRDLSIQSKTHKNPKWIVLDGDIDAEWIESMNTVMDDNKVLTLASNERIPLADSMRMIFEISHLKNATPATVSRAGILFLNETDIGWGPYKESWIERRPDEREKQNLERLFEKYVPFIIEYVRKGGPKHIISISDYNMIQTLCNLLEGLLTKENTPPGSSNDVYEIYFIFACIWAFGGAYHSDTQTDNRAKFSSWWRKTFNAGPIKMPENGTVFDYYVLKGNDGYKFAPWTDLVPKYVHNPDTSFSNIVVHTADTVRLTYVMNLLADHPDKPKPVLLVGTAGTGKTTIVKEKLKHLNEETIYNSINFNSNTDSKTLQLIMEQSLEKKAGVQYGPPGRKKLIYFIDDLNMPKPDKYGTQSAISLVRQHIDYGFWYDRGRMSLKKVSNVQYLACMNPKAGSFTVDDRLQRHFAILACNFPSVADLTTIYNQILSGYLDSFAKAVSSLTPKLVNASIDLHQRVSKVFLPTAIKFHYQFNLRELSNIFQGLSLASKKKFRDAPSIIRLWLHESRRVFGDRLLKDDAEKFDSMIKEVTKKYFDEEKQEVLHAEPLIFTSFMVPPEGDETFYVGADSYEALKNVLNAKLNEYNENYPVMRLELFEQAIDHVCRISRIISVPKGNALLVGVGGSGKQSLARLAAFINGYETFQITVTSKYGITEFRADLIELYKRTGLKGESYSFLITDSQIVDPKMLVYINDLLSSGYIPDLFANDEKDGIIGSISTQVKQAGGDYNSRDACWEFFLEKVRNNLHVVLCFSPVGEQFRIWCRQFPALINCTAIDWFHEWPREALISVANRFLQDVDLGSPEMRKNIAEHMAFVHFSVNEASKQYLLTERRYNYTTPKSFLELIALYKNLLKKKRENLEQMTERLETGLAKLRESAEKVRDLQVVLKEEQVIMKEKEIATDELVQRVGKDRIIVEEQTKVAKAEEEKTNVLVAEVEEFAAQCRSDLEKAEPIVQAAIRALNTLDKNSITELRGFAKPSDDVVKVTSAVMILCADAKKGIPKDLSWNAAKKMMAQVKPFLDSLINFDKEHIPEANVKALEPYLNDPSFNPEDIATKSVAASGLCSWVINIIKFHQINLEVEPKRIKQREAEERLEVSKAGLKKIQDKVAELQERLDGLLAQYEKARLDKLNIEEQAKRTQLKLELAGRLVNGLADENVRWAESIEKLKIRANTLVGDVLLAAAFLSYVGAFSRKFRNELVNERWLPDLNERKIPTTEGIDPLYGVLIDEAQVASWNNEGLPSDRVSTENGTIVVESTRRWPLIIDPQLQGVKWIKNREAKNGLRVVQLTQPKFLDVIEDAITNGFPVLIENIGETIDAILEPVLARSVFKKGRTLFIKLGDKEVEYDDKNFRLYLQTKMSNPHYRPEIAAQTTLVNFMVTEAGLEDQLLATVVNKERPDLEEQRVKLLRELNQFKIDIKKCEDDLLYELTNAKGDILENRRLIENLEETKRKATQIKKSVEEAVRTGQIINENREIYRPVAVRGSLLYFQIDQLSTIDHMYQYSLESFLVVFLKALDKAAASDDVQTRVANITDSITETLFSFVSRGLFERHKLIFATILCFKIMQKSESIDMTQLNFLLRGPKKFGVERPEDVRGWCSENCWNSVQALTEIEGTNPPFSALPEEMSGAWRRWKQWCELEKPEDEKLPLEWKNLTSFQRLLVIRCLRPDRITMAVSKFVGENLGKKYVEDSPIDLEASFVDSGPTTPIFFILSPGVDPVKSVESMGKKYNFTEENGKFVNISLGQGQEKIAEAALERCFKKGGWVMLNNIHLTTNWLINLEKILDNFSELFNKAKAEREKLALEQGASKHATAKTANADTDTQETPIHTQEEAHQVAEGEEGATAEGASPESTENNQDSASSVSPDNHPSNEAAPAEDEYEYGHPDFRVFLSAEPSDKIPLGILQRSIKLTNEPPQGIKANLQRGFMQFNEEVWESSSKQTEFKAILFSLCFFHAIVVERKKFGPQGWNRNYPFNLGDLTTCIAVLNNYLEDRPKIPWDDLRYVFGEIMYGGHITDDWDRRLCMTYLKQYVRKEVVEGIELCPKFQSPPSLSYAGYLEYIETALPAESPTDFGLHPNAEMRFRTAQGETLFKSIMELQPRTASGESGATLQEQVKQILDDILRDLPERYPLQEIAERIEDDRTPFQNVFYQEVERMNILLAEMERSLHELDLGLAGDLTISDKMQALMDALYDDKVPESWAAIAYPSLRPLGSWLVNLQQRNAQLKEWTVDLQMPKVVWLSGFFNPQSFLTAIMQTTARKMGWALDRMTLQAEVTKKSLEEFDSTTRDGAFIHGLYLEGASWDVNAGVLEEAKLKDLYPKMPVMLIKAINADQSSSQQVYDCPVYKTQERGPTYVFTCGLKTKLPPHKWIMAGVALLLDVHE